jgi:hypothetical protein
VVCEVNGGRAAVVRQSTSAPLATITLDSEAFVVLATGRRTATDVSDRITFADDADLGLRVVESLNMMI